MRDNEALKATSTASGLRFGRGTAHMITAVMCLALIESLLG